MNFNNNYLINTADPAWCQPLNQGKIFPGLRERSAPYEHGRMHHGNRSGAVTTLRQASRRSTEGMDDLRPGGEQATQGSNSPCGRTRRGEEGDRSNPVSALEEAERGEASGLILAVPNRSERPSLLDGPLFYSIRVLPSLKTCYILLSMKPKWEMVYLFCNPDNYELSKAEEWARKCWRKPLRPQTSFGLTVIHEIRRAVTAGHFARREILTTLRGFIKREGYARAVARTQVKWRKKINPRSKHMSSLIKQAILEAFKHYTR